MKIFGDLFGKKKDSGWRRCKYGDKCREECGHKIDHECNTACINPCMQVDELTCIHIPVPPDIEIGAC